MDRAYEAGVVNRALALAFLLIASCDRECPYETLDVVPSPGKKYVATVVVENCHATSPFVTIVTVRESGDALDLDQYLFALRAGGTVTVSWQTENTLTISYEEHEVYKQDTRWKDVRLHYVARPNPANP